MKDKKKEPYIPILENIESGCWKDKTGNYFIESFEALNGLFAHFNKVEDICYKINKEINNSTKKKEIEKKLKGVR